MVNDVVKREREHISIDAFVEIDNKDDLRGTEVSSSFYPLLQLINSNNYKTIV